MRPRFRPEFSHQVFPGEGVVYWSDIRMVAFTGPIQERVAPLLDGLRSDDDLVDALEADGLPAEVYVALRQLERAGLLVGLTSELNPSIEAAPFPPSPITLLNLSAIPTAALDPVLTNAGFALGPDQDLTVVAVDDYLDPALESVNRLALQTGRPWLPFKPAGSALWIGPRFRPGRTACWRCVADALRWNRPGHEFIRRRTGRLWRPSAGIVIDRALDRAASWLRNGMTLEPDRLLVLDVATGARSEHPVRRRPQCPACGTGSGGGVPPHSRIQEWSPAPRGPGGRSEPVESFVARHQHLVDPLTGLIAALVPLDTGDPDIHVVLAGPTPVRLDGSLAELMADLRTRCAGKGITAQEAQAAAIGEVVERYSGVFQGDEPRVRATQASLGDAAIAPNEVLGFSERQHRDREQWNRLPFPVAHVPARFDPATEYDWTPVWSVARSATRYLPTAMLFYGHPEFRRGSPFRVDSNGCASGATMDDAILAGILELIERDAAGIWWYNQLALPAIELAGSADPYVRSLTASYRARGRECWGLDLTTDLGIPVVAAVSRWVDRTPAGFAVGLGADVDPAVALRRALIEMNQMLAVTRPFNDGAALEGWAALAGTAEQPQLLPLADQATARASRPPPGDPLVHCRRTLTAHGLELLVLDQTRPDVALPTVRVIVPGLCSMWPRFGLSRLYQSPLRMNRRDVALDEGELNRIPLQL